MNAAHVVIDRLTITPDAESDLLEGLVLDQVNGACVAMSDSFKSFVIVEAAVYAHEGLSRLAVFLVVIGMALTIIAILTFVALTVITALPVVISTLLIVPLSIVVLILIRIFILPFVFIVFARQ